MALVVRALLWVLFIVAPGGVLLLPLLVGDAVARRKREERASIPDAEPPKSQRAAAAVSGP